MVSRRASYALFLPSRIVSRRESFFFLAYTINGVTYLYIPCILWCKVNRPFYQMTQSPFLLFIRGPSLSGTAGIIPELLFLKKTCLDYYFRTYLAQSFARLVSGTLPRNFRHGEKTRLAWNTRNQAKGGRPEPYYMPGSMPDLSFLKRRIWTTIFVPVLPIFGQGCVRHAFRKIQAFLYNTVSLELPMLRGREYILFRPQQSGLVIMRSWWCRRIVIWGRNQPRD